MTAITTTSSTAWQIGQYVHVAPLTSPGFNREGGHGKIIELHHDDGGVVVGIDVKYTLYKATDKNLDPSEVTSYQTLERGNRSRRGRDFLTIAPTDSNAAAASGPAKKKARRSTTTAPTVDTSPSDDEAEDVAVAVVVLDKKKSKNEGGAVKTTKVVAKNKPITTFRDEGASENSQNDPSAGNSGDATGAAAKKKQSQVAKKTRAPPLAAKKGATKKGMNPKNTAATAVLPVGIPKTIIATSDSDSAISPLAFPKNLAPKATARRQLVLPNDKKGTTETAKANKANPNLDRKPAAESDPDKHSTKGKSAVRVPTATAESDDSHPEVDPTAITPIVAVASKPAAAPTESQSETNLKSASLLSTQDFRDLSSRIWTLVTRDSGEVEETVIFQDLGHENPTGKVFTNVQVEACLERLCNEDRIMRSGGVVYSVA